LQRILLDEEIRNLSLDQINLVNEEEEIILGFDTANLPSLGFDACCGWNWILTIFIVVGLGRRKLFWILIQPNYLPIGFNAYEGMELKP